MKPQNNNFNAYICFKLSVKCPLLFYIQFGYFFLHAIFRIKYCLTAILKKPGGGAPALNVKTIRDQRHASLSKAQVSLSHIEG